VLVISIYPLTVDKLFSLGRRDGGSPRGHKIGFAKRRTWNSSEFSRNGSETFWVHEHIGTIDAQHNRKRVWPDNGLGSRWGKARNPERIYFFVVWFV
jgi:hypothetical protein